MEFEDFASNRAKWDFSTRSLQEQGVVDNETLLECWAYEFSRENSELRNAILEWRESLGYPLSFERLKQHSYGSPVLRIEGDPVQEIPDRLINIRLPATYVFFPEWPGTSFLEIPSEERTRRIELGKSYSWYSWRPNWIKGLDEYPASLEADPRSLGLHPGWPKPGAWEDLVKHLWVSASKNQLRAFEEDELCGWGPETEFRDPEPGDFVYAKAEYVLFRIPWKYDDGVILSLLAEWLLKNRPDCEKPPKISGDAKTGKPPLRTIKAHLEMLSKWRLVKNNGGDIATLHPITDQLLFNDASHWSKTDITIRREFRRFTPQS